MEALRELRCASCSTRLTSGRCAGLSGSTHPPKPLRSSSWVSRDLGAGSLKREGGSEGRSVCLQGGCLQVGAPRVPGTTRLRGDAGAGPPLEFSFPDTGTCTRPSGEQSETRRSPKQASPGALGQGPPAAPERLPPSSSRVGFLRALRGLSEY